MPTFSTLEDIQKAIQLFNKHAYNAGFEFKVYSSEASCLYIQASFDFGYYVNVDIECREVFYTNIDPKASWPDAWHNDQVFLLTDDELENIIDFREITIPADKPYFGIVFNIIGKDNYFINGTVICSSLYISWRHPNKNEEYEFHTLE
ncbi:hypothetical protein ACQ33O_11910 [Ferruginibacter sp. SUN002]|uniref:hypothetical protein n=1 Tax=Ferruginibacter sp. SUN002 TaxID=2937789 RepID=UPI003D35A6EC